MSSGVGKPANIKECTTAGDALDVMTAKLTGDAINGAREDAMTLLISVCGLTREELVLDSRTPLTTPVKNALENALQRRLAREPTTRILGHREFYGRSFRITPDVLDPRPDTETLVSVVLDYVDARGLRDKSLRILDVGTGSGALLVTLLTELPSATGLGTDISAAALDVARANSTALGVGDRSRFEHRDGVAGLDGPFEIIVSNPPYVARDDIPTLMTEVRSYDPHVALDGGSDGLDFYRGWGAQLIRLAPNGIIAVEVGFDQSAAVQDIFRTACAPQDDVEITTAKDLAGHVRCVAALTLSSRRTESLP